MSWEEGLLRNIEKTSSDYIDVKEIGIGRVISTSPLQIMLGDLPLYSKNLYINAELLPHSRGYTVILGDPHSLNSGSIRYKEFIYSGDLVALSKIDDTRYIVLCKVVKGW